MQLEQRHKSFIYKQHQHLINKDNEHQFTYLYRSFHLFRQIFTKLYPSELLVQPLSIHHYSLHALCYQDHQNLRIYVNFSILNQALNSFGEKVFDTQLLPFLIFNCQLRCRFEFGRNLVNNHKWPSLAHEHMFQLYLLSRKYFISWPFFSF